MSGKKKFRLDARFGKNGVDQIKKGTGEDFHKQGGRWGKRMTRPKMRVKKL